MNDYPEWFIQRIEAITAKRPLSTYEILKLLAEKQKQSLPEYVKSALKQFIDTE